MAISVQNAALLSAAAYATIPNTVIDTGVNGEKWISFFFTADALNPTGVWFKIQGSNDNQSYVDIQSSDDTIRTTIDATTQGTEVFVASGSSAFALIAPETFRAINSSWRYYRVQCVGKNGSPFGTGTVSIMAK